MAAQRGVPIIMGILYSPVRCFYWTKGHLVVKGGKVGGVSLPVTLIHILTSPASGKGQTAHNGKGAIKPTASSENKQTNWPVSNGVT